MAYDPMERYEELLRQQNKVHTDDGENYFIDDENCQECGHYFPKLMALACGNGYFSWRCAKCWEIHWKRLKSSQVS